MMSNEVEELSDEMKLEQQMEMRESMGKTSLAFFDLQDMSLTMKLLYLAGILTLFAIAF